MDTSRGRSPSQWLLATVLAAAAALVLPGVAAATSQTFTANGTFTVPAGVTSLAVDVLGAQGGGAEGQIVNPGGRGGEATGTVAVTPGEALTVVVGGTGGHTQRSGPAGRGGANGGGEGGSTAGAGGGGRSEVDRGTTPLVVAGGGGGATPSPEALGGSGGGLTGHGGGSLSSNGGGGGTQTAGGTAGLGIDVSPGSPGTAGVGGAGGSGANGGGGGGGGFFGGGGGGAGSTTVNAGGGGGGSGHLDASVTDGVLTADQHEGGGQVTITYTGDDASVRSSSAPLEQVIGPPTASSSNGSGSSSSSTPASPPAASGLSGLGSPSNAFNFARVRVGGRVLRLGFDYPGRGTLDAIVTTRRPGAESARLRPGPHRVTVGKVHDSADSAQTKTLVIPLTRRGKRILAHRGKLPIRVSLVFTPDGGPSARQAHKYTVRPRGRG